jgi:hypothetical protein
MAKVRAIHTIARTLDDQQTEAEFPVGTVFECEGQELEDLRKAGAVEDVGDDEPLSELSTVGRSDAALSPPATSTLIPGAVAGDKVAASQPVEPQPVPPAEPPPAKPNE